MRIKRKRFVFNHMRLFYCREKPTALLRHRSKSIKKHMFRWNLYVRIFLFKRKLLKHLWKRKRMGYLNAWLRNCRSIFYFMKKEDRKENTWRAVEQFLLVFLWTIRDQAKLWKAVHFSLLHSLKSSFYK